MASGRRPDAKRRAEIARLHGGGLTMAEIGRRLGISRQAVCEALIRLRHPLPLPAVACAGCAAPIASAGALPSDDGHALCLGCLAARPDVPFGVRLKAFRLAAGWTKAQLAERANVTAMTIHHYETGAREPRWRQLAPLVCALGPGLVTLGLRQAR
jgi:DNA-binding XRE family transcriptional regulator